MSQPGDTPQDGAATTSTAPPDAANAPGAPATDAAPIPVEQRIAAAVKAWTSQLIDVGGRNNLLYYRDLKAGTLDIAEAREPVVESLLMGRPVRISSLFPDLQLRMDALRRVRTIHGRTREHFEEKGIATLYLAAGLASWTNQRTTTTPAAPILLRPAELRTRGAAQDDFELQLTGEMEVNPVLMHLLRTEFGRDIPPNALWDRLDGTIDSPWELEEAYTWLADEARVIPGFSVRPRLVLGNFLYAKLPMVRDLESSTARLATHDLVAAIAGDPEARHRLKGRHDQVTVDPREPDHLPPDREFLVLDADASQNVAINRVLRGQDLIIKGPPGTGKSQTIANLIASLIGMDKKVLFVAEKRAAIDAVFHRLDHAGLADLLLDLHGGTGARRQTAENLAKALSAMSTAPRPPTDALANDLVAARTKLTAHADAMHLTRAPWGVSLIDAIDRATRVPAEARVDIRMKADDLQRLDAPSVEAAASNLREFLDLGGAALAASPWANAPVDDPQAARDLFDRFNDFRHDMFPALRDLLWAALGETRLPPADRSSQIDERMHLWLDTRTVLGRATPEIFSADLDRLATDLAPAESLVKRIVAFVTSSRYRAARVEALTLMTDPDTSDAAMLVTIQIARGVAAGWTRLAPGTVPTVPTQLDRLAEVETAFRSELWSLAHAVGWTDFEDMGRDELAHAIDRLLADRTTLLRLPDLRRTRSALVAAGLEPVLRHAIEGDLGAADAVEVLAWVWLNSVIERVEFVEPALVGFDAERLRDTASRYGKLDHQHLTRTATRLRRQYAEHGIAQRDRYPDEAATITKQAALKRRHMPLRDLFRAAPHALLGVKPCWAMSPLVVSQVLPADQTYFDVVIFDEASQVTPADAIPSIMRGRSVVVAGDDKQLPPTSFFMATQPEDEILEAEPDDLELTHGFESVLDSLSAILPATRLEWHYRSQDERLIAFSNREFYDGALVTFPGVAGRGSIDHVLVVPGAAAGQEESSNAEVREVIRLVFQHAKDRPDESLGVIAMGITHANRIEEALRQALHGRTDMDAFFDETREERFFVKNLERVQGDERDAIILSIGYGKSADGRLLHRFGPINLEGGERRLNVAVTRARRRMTVVSSFSAAEMDPTKTTRRGASLLRSYLAYAESASRNGHLPAGLTDEEDLASTVRTALIRAGLTADLRVGSSAQWIDVAVNDPDDAERYVLAVETDGPGYQRIATTRDRDRLRHEQLERLGWQHHRLWSMEWLRDQGVATDRIVARAHAAAAAADAAPVAVPQIAEPTPIPDPPTVESVRGPRPPIGGYMKIDDIPFSNLVGLIDWIESDGILRTEDEVVKIGVDELGFQRRGSRIDAALRSATSYARSRRKPA